MAHRWKNEGLNEDRVFQHLSIWPLNFSVFIHVYICLWNSNVSSFKERSLLFTWIHLPILAPYYLKFGFQASEWHHYNLKSSEMESICTQAHGLVQYFQNVILLAWMHLKLAVNPPTHPGCFWSGIYLVTAMGKGMHVHGCK